MELAYEGKISQENRMTNTNETANISSYLCLCSCPDMASFAVSCDIKDAASII